MIVNRVEQWFRMATKAKPTTNERYAIAGKELGDRIRALMLQRKWDKSQFRQALVTNGMSEAAADMYVSRLENNKLSKPQRNTRDVLCKVFDITDRAQFFEPENPKLYMADIVSTNLPAAIASTNEEIVSDIRHILADPDLAPYLRITAKILRTLTSP